MYIFYLNVAKITGTAFLLNNSVLLIICAILDKHTFDCRLLFWLFKRASFD